jgi:copper transporter 1
MFAASCIGVAFLSVANEALRRFCREYDQLVMRQLGEVMEQRNNGPPNPLWFIDSYNHGPPRATAFQQLIRTILHVMSVGVGYILMLVLMSFNGYTFISILIGTGIGKFFSDWLTVGQ